MRRTSIQLIVLLIAGMVVVWREWTAGSFLESTAANMPLLPPFFSEQITDTSSSIIWLVGVAGIVVVLTECCSRYFKLSSPNSV